MNRMQTLQRNTITPNVDRCSPPRPHGATEVPAQGAASKASQPWVPGVRSSALKGRPKATGPIASVSLPRAWCALLHGAALLLLTCGLLACKAEPSQSDAPASGGEPTPSNSPAPIKLVIVTPHDEFIKREFNRAFIEDYAARHNGAKIDIDYQDRGGTNDAVKYLISTYKAVGDDAKGIGIDLMFGGGVPAFEELKRAGITQPATLPAETLAAVPASLGGVHLRDPEGHWFGAVLSSFGIIYNKSALAAKGIPEPKSWGDLADPAYLGQLIQADPSKSGSTRVCYEVILQKYGWEDGWGLLMKIAGNTREFTGRSAQVPNEVAHGSALAGMSIDFYAYAQIEENGADVVGYVSPENATAITPDPIALLKNAPNKAAAEEFIAFLLSEKGQLLWGLKQGLPGGPTEKGLWRLPILPTIYTQRQADMLVQFNPFQSLAGFQLDQELSTVREPLIGPLFVAAFLNNSATLRAAWQGLINHPENKQAAASFTAVPFPADQIKPNVEAYSSNTREMIRLEDEWTTAFRARYDEIIKQTR